MQNSQCSLCGDGDATVNHIISECSKLTQMEIKDKAELCVKDDLLVIVQKIKF